MFGLMVVGAVLDVVVVLVVIAVGLIDGVVVVGDWVVGVDEIVALVAVGSGRVVTGDVEVVIGVLVGEGLVDNGANVSMSESVVLTAGCTVIANEVVVSVGVMLASVGEVVIVVVSFCLFGTILFGREFWS